MLLLWLWLFWLASVASAFVRSSPSLLLHVVPKARESAVRARASPLPSGRGAASAQRANTVYDTLTILLPAYNESNRIIDTLKEYSSYVSKGGVLGNNPVGSLLSIDILVVDDGSADDTAGIVRRYSECNQNRRTTIDCISLRSNEGKGAAIARGIQEIGRRQQKSPDIDDDDKYSSRSSSSSSSKSRSDGRTSLVLVADADGSGDLSCLGNMFHALDSLLNNQQRWEASQGTAALIVGNRRGYDGAGIARTVLRWGFRTAVRIICGNLGVSDTQCGMKLLTLDAANTLYRDLNLRRWSHDVEVLYRAKTLGMPVAEVPVIWEDKDGSKLVTSPGGAIRASLRMLLEIIQMRIEYGLGKWQVPNEIECRAR